MMDIESHTVVYLRDLLATRVVLEPDVTAFLSCWVYEELWHGEAFSRFLGEAGFVLVPDREAVSGGSSFPSKVGRNGAIRRSVGRGATVTHPVLIELLRRIIKDERRHFAFYRAQARQRLAASRNARRVTRWAMEYLWAPVGTGVRPQTETDFVIVSLFGDEAGRRAVAELDAGIQELPGFEDARLLERSLGRALHRLPREQQAWHATDEAMAAAGIIRNEARQAAAA